MDDADDSIKNPWKTQKQHNIGIIGDAYYKRGPNFMARTIFLFFQNAGR